MTKISRLVALCACAVLTAQAQDMPARKPGLWTLTMQMSGMPGGGTTSQQCIDKLTDAELQRKAMAGDPKHRCTQKSIKRIAGGVELEAECTAPEGRITVRSRATGDFDKAYTVDSQMTFDPPQHGMTQAGVKISARHLGDCPAGMSPGQTRVAGGGPGMLQGIDPKAMQGMSPEQMRQMAEQMKKAAGRAGGANASGQ